MGRHPKEGEAAAPYTEHLSEAGQVLNGVSPGTVEGHLILRTLSGEFDARHAAANLHVSSTDLHRARERLRRAMKISPSDARDTELLYVTRSLHNVEPEEAVRIVRTLRPPRPLSWSYTLDPKHTFNALQLASQRRETGVMPILHTHLLPGHYSPELTVYRALRSQPLTPETDTMERWEDLSFWAGSARMLLPGTRSILTRYIHGDHYLDAEGDRATALCRDEPRMFGVRGLDQLVFEAMALTVFPTRP